MFEKIFDSLDLASAILVYGVTVFLKSVLNNLPFTRDRYTDWMFPFVALVLGQLIAYASFGKFDLNVFLLGLNFGGGAIIFERIVHKGLEGISLFTDKGKADPVIQEKIKKNQDTSEARINHVKELLRKNKP